MQFWSLAWFATALADQTCNVTIDKDAGSGTTAVSSSELATVVCFRNLLPSERYMVRLFSAGFSAVSFSPDVAFVSGSEPYMTVNRALKTAFAASNITGDFVISVDRLWLGVFPESLVPVVLACTICVLFSIGISPYLISLAS